MDEYKVVWDCAGMAVVGKVALIREATRALIPVMQEKVELGYAVMLMAVELRALGAHVVIEVRPGHVLRHANAGCRRVYTKEEWNALPAIPCMCVAFSNERTIAMPSRQCGCGSHITYASMELIHAEDLCNTKGGKA